MFKSTLTGAAIAAVMVLSMTGTASAGGPPPAEMLSCAYDLPAADYCNAELQNLCGTIENGDFTNDRDRFNLIGKVIEAANKINSNKFADADQKLDDIQMKVDALAGAAKPKLGADSADAITFARIEASLCVSGLGG